MARSFAGSTSTDKIAFGAPDLSSTLRSVSFWAYYSGTVDATARRVYEQVRAAGGLIDQVLWDTSNTFMFQAGWSTAAGQWELNTPPSTDTWFHCVVTYDASSTSNDPVFYINGSVSANSEVVAPSGTLLSGTGNFNIGNRTGGDRAWSGYIAEWARWDVILDAGEIASLSKAFSPILVRPSSLLGYVPLIGKYSPETELINALSGTVTGATAIAHPRIIYPTGTPLGRKTTVAASTVRTLAALGVG